MDSVDDDARLRRFRLRRREPAQSAVAFLERMQSALVEGPPSGPPRLTANDIRRAHPSATDAEVAALLAHQAGPDSSIRPPTRYEELGVHKSVQLVASRIDEAVVRAGRGRGSDPPLVGLLDVGHLNARTMRMPGDDGHLVLVDRELLQFLFLFGKAVALAVPSGPTAPAGMLGFATKRADVRAHLRQDDEAVRRFLDAVFSYVTTGRASAAEPYRVAPGAQRFSSIVVQAAHTFLLAHEYAHVLEDHVGDGEQSPRWSMNLEGVADTVGLQLTIDVMQRTGHDLYFTYWGAELVLFATETALKAISLLRSGNDVRGMRDDELHQHAAFEARRTMLEFLVRGEMERATGDKDSFERQWQEISEGLHVMRDIVAELWHETEPLLRLAHDQGARPAAVWES
ncbi:hypothetical protein [Prauserella cavernicola]|uniref:Uncharacterized protein n=1 Tax=Prauserella cavernicola TaxID=2800127 RepID=A0A934QRM1_9PSEU|nr:hypothetical protein [Prauserella cavernicola]MBK1784414.1 hypothetical protein [Prauserella cavernicola]